MSKTTRPRLLVSAGAALSLATLAAPAFAQNVEDCPGRQIDITNSLVASGDGDDGSYEYTIPTELFPDGIPFVGAGQTRLWVNINGNLSFEGPEPTYTPDAIPGLTQPTIAPYFADVDLRSPFLRENPGRITICGKVGTRG